MYIKINCLVIDKIGNHVQGARMKTGTFIMQNVKTHLSWIIFLDL